MDRAHADLWGHRDKIDTSFYVGRQLVGKHEKKCIQQTVWNVLIEVVSIKSPKKSYSFVLGVEGWVEESGKTLGRR